MLANDFAALNKPPMETSFQVTEDFITEVTQEKQEDGSVKEVTHYDMERVAAELKKAGLIEYEWFFRLFAWFYHADTKLNTGTFTLNTEMDYMALVRSMRTTGGKTETVELTPACRALAPKLNPDYDSTIKYQPRTQRPEWAAVGLLGKLVAVDDGSCQVNGWAAVGKGGKAAATAVRTRYRVMARLDDTHVRIMIF